MKNTISLGVWQQIALVAIFVCINAAAQDVRDESKDKPVTRVRAQDIPRTVQIVGRVGEPLGKVVTIRGKWFTPGDRVKDNSIRLRVELVNGKKPEAEIELFGAQITNILGDKQRGRKPKAGELWDWRIDSAGTESPPKPLEGETWEMLGVEYGSFDFYSEDVWREIGSPPPQIPEWIGGFATRFEYIAVRRIK